MFEIWKNHLYGKVDHYLTNRKAFKDNKTKKIFEISETFFDSISGLKVAEFGCNVGRNLIPYIDNNCDVYGFDISYKAINYCNQTYKGNFIECDLFNESNILDQYEDDYFDLGLCVGFLMHLPPQKEKQILIENIIRVCKNIILSEVVETDIHKTNELITEKKGYFLSLEDYKDYDNRFIIVDKIGNETVYKLNK